MELGQVEEAQNDWVMEKWKSKRLVILPKCWRSSGTLLYGATAYRDYLEFFNHTQETGRSRRAKLLTTPKEEHEFEKIMGSWGITKEPDGHYKGIAFNWTYLDSKNQKLLTILKPTKENQS
jgi:hypothetical protein